MTEEAEGGDGPPEPDYRFLLANERTFLAYVRTSLALGAAVVGIGQLFDGPGWARVASAVVCGCLGVLVALRGASRWRVNDRAIRRGDALTPPPNMWLLSLGLVTAIVVLLVAGLAG